MLDGDSYSRFLGEELARRTAANPRYSQRAFARCLGLSPGELSEILRGRRKLSERARAKISQALSLPRHQLSLDLFSLVSDWYCFAILNLAECEDFRWDARWIARRLGLTEEEVNNGIARLERVGLLKRVRGKLAVRPDYVLSPEGIPSEAIRNYHRQVLGLAIQAVDHQAVEEREIAGIDFAIDPAHIPDIKRDISVFLDELVERYARGKKRKDVYHCEVAFFRLSEKRER